MATKKPAPFGQGKQLCVLAIDHYEFAMPAADGMRVAQMMQRAQRVHREFMPGVAADKFKLRGEPEVRWESVQAKSLGAPSKGDEEGV